MDNQTFSDYYYYYYSDFPDGKSWRMREKGIDRIIEKLESSGTPLGNWKIRNRLAMTFISFLR